jgi:hypothetical protein
MLVALEGLVVRGSGGLLREDRATNFATQRSKSCNGDLEELRRRDEGGIERERLKEQEKGGKVGLRQIGGRGQQLLPCNGEKPR